MDAAAPTRRRFLGLLGLGALAWALPARTAGAAEADPGAAMAVRGLDHLARSQLADGSWSGHGQGAGVVGACLLALLAHGHQPSRSPHGLGACARRARDWLLAHADADGAITGGGFTPMYQHALATLALAEALGAGDEPRLRRAVAAAVAVILRCQNANGGWRHRLATDDGDELPASVGQLMALRAAANAGLALPEAALARAEGYVRACQNRWVAGGDGGFRYTLAAGPSNWPRSGAGCAALQMLGRYRDPAVREGLACIERYQPLGPVPVAETWWWHFGAYHVALAVWLARGDAEGDERWRRLQAGLEAELARRQGADGGWRGDYQPFETAAALLVLGFPHGYLPIHQG